MLQILHGLLFFSHLLFIDYVNFIFSLMLGVIELLLVEFINNFLLLFIIAIFLCLNPGLTFVLAHILV